jgi:hypothetical protein
MQKRKVTLESKRQTQTRNRALRVLSHMRRTGVSLATASRLEHTKPATVLRHVGSAVRRERPGSRYHATRGDRFRRDLQIPTAQGPVTVSVVGSKQAESISKYLNAVSHYLRTGDESKLRSFKGKAIKAGKQRIKLLTDPDTLLRLAEADAMHLDQLYASRAGR